MLKTINQIVNDSRKKNYDIIQVLFPKGSKEQLKKRVTDHNITLPEYIVHCVNAQNNDLPPNSISS